MKHEERWFRVRGTVTYETEWFVQATTREEAEQVYLGIDDPATGDVLEERLLEVEECEPPL
jgi:hypothetical protein